MSLDANIAEEVAAVRSAAGVWLRADHTFVRVTGADAATWLQSQTTNDVVALESGEGQANAALDRQGRVQGFFTLHRWQEEYWMLVDRTQWPHLHAHLESHLFIEDAQLEDAGEEVEQVVVQGPGAAALLAWALGDFQSAAATLPAKTYGCGPVELDGVEALAFRVSVTGEDGYVLVTERGQGERLRDALLQSGGDGRAIGPDAQEVLRIEAGIPRWNVDVDENHIISETTLDRDAVSHTKGCYLGQEVVARLKTYGSPKRALMGLLVSTQHGLEARATAVSTQGKKIGQITSACFSPTLNANIALAYLGRDYRTPGRVLDFTTESGDSVRAEIRVLPFVEAPDREARARSLYEEALKRFEADLADEDASAIPLLEEAILLAPTFEDAYEVLGVILHRHGRLEEAIAVMETLAEINPDCQMAHTNLSVFYVAQGRIEDAEEEKAKAAVLAIKRATDERKAKEMAESERRRLEEEARERIGMFQEVLEIDPDDPLATFGLGKAYVQLNQHADAIPYFQRSTQLQKDYSVAWLNLGQCHETVGNTSEAVAAYRAGIEAATRKGDLMPLREMERRLKTLEAQAARTP